MGLSSLVTLDKILAVVSSADVAALRKISQDWRKVISEIESGHGKFAKQTGELANHWKGDAFQAYAASAAQAASGMAAWAQRGPERAQHVDRVAEIVEYMKWLLEQKQKNERNPAEQMLENKNIAAKRLVDWWDNHPQPKPAISHSVLELYNVRHPMVGLNETQMLYAKFVTYNGQLIYHGYAIGQAHKELFDFYDKVARDIADRWGAEITQLTPWVSPPAYIGLGKGINHFVKPVVETPEQNRPPGGPGGGGVTKPGTNTDGTPPPPKHELKQETRPFTKQQPEVDPPPRQDNREGQPQSDPQSQQQQPGTPPPAGGAQPPPGSGGVQPPPGSGGSVIPPPIGGGQPGTVPPLLPVPGAFVPAGSRLDPPAGGSGGSGGSRSSGSGAPPTLAGRLTEAGNVLNGRTVASAGQTGATPPMYPPMAPGAGQAGGNVGGRSARMRRPVPLGGPRVIGETPVGQGNTVTGRPADRKKLEPPRQADEPVTGWETPVEETEEHQHAAERRYGV